MRLRADGRSAVTLSCDQCGAVGPIADQHPDHGDLCGPCAVRQGQRDCYCGCCGREIGAGTRTDPEWCADCKPHLRRGPLFAPWQRTYFAQHGKDCPWQVGA